MKYVKKVFFCILFTCFTLVATAQYIEVDDTKTAQQLVENVLVNSSCAAVSNFTVSGDTYTSGQNSYGSFSATSNFPFTAGVLLSTWSSVNSVGPFVRNRGGGDDLWIGDSDLNQTLGIASVNATSLEFDFTPLTNFISFNYVFASNEYQDYFPCAFSDGFAFLIKEKGSTDSYTNLAVLPNTTSPVSSENVHPQINNFTAPNGTFYSGCPAVNEIYFNGFNTFLSPTNYSGQTKVLTAKSNVIAGKTYHIKLVIADDKEQYFDSAVFIEAGSFSSTIDLGPDRIPETNNPLCFGESFVIDTKLPATYMYTWFKNNIVIPAANASTYTVTEAGVYRVEVIFSPSTCGAQDEIKIDYSSAIVLNNSSIVQCDDNGDGITVFDLKKADGIVKNNDISIINVDYYNSLQDAQSQINPILNPNSFTNSSNNQIIFARAVNSYGCANYSQVQLKISNNAIAFQNPIAICDEDDIQDGFYNFDLNLQVTPQILMGLPAGLVLDYYLNINDAILQKNSIANNFSNTVANEQIIYARVANGSDCYDIIPITLVINTFNPPDFEEEILFMCDGNPIDLKVASDFYSYLWDNGNDTNSITITSAGNYSITVSDAKGCKKTKVFVVKNSGIATITAAVINDFAGTENAIQLQYTGLGNYKFSINESSFQEESIFKGLTPGIYYAIAKDKNGCGVSNSFTVYVLDYSRYFTPNNDGYNDTWKIENMNILPQANIFIFDRYGKLLKQTSSTNSSWNGTLNGLQLPSSDYWFHVIFDNGRIVKGHFSLKR